MTFSEGLRDVEWKLEIIPVKDNLVKIPLVDNLFNYDLKISIPTFMKLLIKHHIYWINYTKSYSVY